MLAAKRSAPSPANPDEREPWSLDGLGGDIQEGAKMLLPGVQVLFGFQLIAVFNQRLQEQTSPGAQRLHLLAMTLVVVAMGLLMTPAAYRRRSELGSISRRLVRLSTRMLALSTYPLMVGVCLDFYLVASVIVDGVVSLVLAISLFGLFGLLWLILPRVRALRDALGR